MSEHTAPEPGATDNQRTDSETGQDTSIDELAAENQELRERVEELEATLESLQAGLGDDPTTDETEGTSGPTTDRADETDGPATETTPPLVTGGGKNCKIIGTLDDADGIGIYGENKATSGTATGIEGVSDSSDEGATAVRGETTATSGQTYGVYGTGNSPSSLGVVGDASAGSLSNMSAGQPVGVIGHTDRSGTDNGVVRAFGVFGKASATSGRAHGVYGKTNSDDGYGLYSDGDSYAGGDHLVQGDIVTNATGMRTSRLYFGDDTTPHGRLVHDNTEDTFSLSANVKSGATFEVQMDMELNQDGTKQRTAGPIAKGYISDGGSITSAVNVDSVSWDSGANWYEISLTNITYEYNQFVTTVTSSDRVAAGTGSTGDGELLVYFEDDNQHDFQFVTYDLP